MTICDFSSFVGETHPGIPSLSFTDKGVVQSLSGALLRFQINDSIGNVVFEASTINGGIVTDGGRLFAVLSPFTASFVSGNYTWQARAIFTGGKEFRFDGGSWTHAGAIVGTGDTTSIWGASTFATSDHLQLSGTTFTFSVANQATEAAFLAAFAKVFASQNIDAKINGHRLVLRGEKEVKVGAATTATVLSTFGVSNAQSSVDSGGVVDVKLNALHPDRAAIVFDLAAGSVMQLATKQHAGLVPVGAAFSGHSVASGDLNHTTVANATAVATTLGSLIVTNGELTVSAVTVYCYAGNAGNTVQAAIYTAAGAQIGSATAVVSVATGGLKKMTFATPIILAAGTAYYVCITCTSGTPTFICMPSDATWSTTPIPGISSTGNLPSTLTIVASSKCPWLQLA